MNPIAVIRRILMIQVVTVRAIHTPLIREVQGLTVDLFRGIVLRKDSLGYLFLLYIQHILSVTLNIYITKLLKI